ncbi:hypothetical protein [Prescottella agglutinans]|uniref:Uncharacterized protein n=1 Tax=Prescottella agglutinans TaxID=1644129 RepID=A0ABT6M4Z0_9NOCA|nr:hypothetical protein [Prescottella agglutinans]MDH6279355.1 hypothetical protein [Prescottella agglutinans]
MGVRVFADLANEVQQFNFPDAPGWTIDEQLGRLHVHDSDLVTDIAVFDSWSCVTRLHDDGEAED